MRLLSRLLMIALAASVFMTALPSPANAANAADWKAGRIIDDGIFANPNDMSVADIQNFLNNKVPVCDTNGTLPASEYGRPDLTHAQYAATRGWPAPPYACLRNYHEVPKNAPSPGMPDNSYNHGGGAFAGGVSAAQLIYNAAQAYQISVRVLLVTIQKESAGPLTTDTWPLQTQYQYAMGAHCPDSGPGGSANCDPNYAGFSIQIAEAAALMRWYLDSMQQPWWQYKKPFQTNSILWSPNSSCGAGNVYIETKATAALYTYTPYQPNAAALANLYGTGDGCSAYGNRNFWRIYTDWFGNTSLPLAFKTPSNGTVYVQTNGYKFAVPSMSVLQDFGIAPQSIATVSQSIADAIPVPPGGSGLTTSIGRLAKSSSDADADGSTLYFVTVGKKYPVPSMTVFNSYGFSTSDIRYLPLAYLQSIPTDSLATNFVQTPNGSLFQVASSAKSYIFDLTKYNSLAQGSYYIPISDGFASLVASTNPQSTNPVVLKSSTSSSVYALTDGQYYAFPNLTTYTCWGIGTKSALSLHVINAAYISSNISPTGSLSCLMRSPSNTTFLFSKNKRLSVPDSYGFAASTTLPTSLSNLYNSLPVSGVLPQAVKASGPSVWYLEDGKRKAIPSYSNLTLLGLATSYGTVDQSSLASFPQQGIKLGVGQIVKSATSNTVYVVSGNKRLAIPSSETFTGFRYKWSQVESYSAAQLTDYPVEAGATLRDFFTNGDTMKTYAIGPEKCYEITNELLADFAQVPNNNLSAQTYGTEVFPYLNLGGCTPATKFIKSNSSSTVYSLDAGTKHPVSSWQTLVSLNGGSAPTIITLSPNTISSFTTGSTL